MEQVKIADSKFIEIVADEPDPKLTDNALRVLQKRYLKKDDKGRVIETPKELFARVAWNLAQAERNYGASEAQVEETARRFYRIIANLEFLPNSPTLMNAGLDLQQLSACFVLPVDDSLIGIFEALKHQALIHQSGGGTGMSFSRLRPKGDFVKSTMGVASGPVSFMKIFDAATQTVKQGGCISVDSLLRTSEGLKPLGRLLNCPPLGENFTRDRIFDGTGFSHALVAQDNGPSEIFSIETELGLRIGATYNHAFAVVDESGAIVWREAQDLRVGDWLIIVKGGHLGFDRSLPPLGSQHPNATRIRVPLEMNDALAELLGLYMADGCTSTGGRFIITVGTVDIEVMDRIRFLMERNFGLAPNQIKEGEGGGYFDIQFQSRDLVRWMERLGWVKGYSPNAFIPSEVLGGSGDTARAFLRGLFEGDGHIHSGSGYPSFSTTSERLAIEAQQLLLSLGVVARRGRIARRQNALGHRTVHTLTIVDEDSVRTFAAEIGFVSDRKQEHLELGPRPKVNTSDIIPNQGAVLRSLYSYVGRGSGPGRSRRGANRTLYRALMHYISEQHPRALPRKRLLALMERFPLIAASDRLRQMVDSSRVYTRVINIWRDHTPTADLEVPGPASFVANGILVHNKRRGANMGILRVDHPDILEFITCKDKTTEVTNFNISVAITDKFMEAMKAGTKYDLVNPRNHEVVGQLDAREVLDKIAFQAWKNGEPGLFFIDENNRRQPTPNVGDMEATNPCVTGDTLVSTGLGLIPIEVIADRYPNGGISLVTDRRVPAEVVTESNGMLLASRDEAERGTRLGPMVAAWRTGVKPVWKVATKSGFELTATADHKVLTTAGWVSIEELVPGVHKLLIQSGEGRFPEHRELPFKPSNVYIGENGKTTVLNLPTEWSRELGLVLGWLVGDGWLRSGDKNCRVGFTFAKSDAPVFATLRPILNRWYGRNIRGVKMANGVYHLSYHSRFFVDFFEKLGVRPVDSAEKEVPRFLFTAPRAAVVGFLQGLFTADGTIRDHRNCNSSGIALTSKSRKLLQGVQLLLLNLGIRSRVLNRSRAPRMALFTYVTKAGERRAYGSDGVLYELFIFGESRHRFECEVGFLDEKQAELSHVRYPRFYQTKFEDPLKTKEQVGDREVFDLTEAASHSMVCNGIVVRQCGEQPLLPYESCNLGSIDLARHMKRSAAGRWDVDWKRLEGTIRATVRMLDDVIDMNAYPVKEIEEMTRATRKIGLGVMGFARMLFMLEVPYDSKEGVEWGRKIMRFIQETGYNESAKLAEERGVYPAWEGSRHQEKGLHVRNSYVTTVAPTGTLSMIADTSGGCEPEFSLIWYKRVMDGEELPYFLDYFEEVAKREGFWRDDLVQKILDNHGSPRGLKDVPEKWQRVFATAHDVAPEWHVRMQAAFQDWCDAAVSKTINLPREATVEDVKKAYLLAHDLHCKGITVYRDGSREDQVLNIGVAEAEKPKEVRVEVPPEPAALRPRARPDVITGRTQKILTGYGALYVTVNEDEKGLFEVFAQIGRGGGYTASFTEGIARLVSLCLRSGVPVDEIIDQLEGIRSPRIAVDHGERVYSIPDAIAKAIKRHIGMQKTGVQPPVETFDELGGAVETDIELEKESRDAAELLKKGLNPECPECGKPLVFEEGCVKCHACGYSEC